MESSVKLLFQLKVTLNFQFCFEIEELAMHCSISILALEKLVKTTTEKHSLSHVEIETGGVPSEGHLTLSVDLVHEEFGAVGDNLSLSETLPGVTPCVMATHHVQVIGILTFLTIDMR